MSQVMFRGLEGACRFISVPYFSSCSSESTSVLKTSREKDFSNTQFNLPSSHNLTCVLLILLNIPYYIFRKAKPIVFLQIFLLLIYINSLYMNNFRSIYPPWKTQPLFVMK